MGKENSFKGSTTKIGVIIILLLLLNLFTKVYMRKKETEKGNQQIETYIEEKVEDIENERYVSEKVKFDIREKIKEDTNYQEVTITGTEKEVKKGEEVFVTVEMKAYNRLGTVARILEVNKTGIAK